MTRWVGLGLALCASAWMEDRAMADEKTFGEDVAYLQEHTETFTLSRGDSRIAVTPEYQGRVMTSTTGGADGKSIGWINYDLVAVGEFQDHINVFGGEDRFWLGPEGGQFAVFFGPGADYTLDDWQTPAPIDTEPYSLVERDKHSALFRHEFEVSNKSGMTFEARVDRRIELLASDDAPDGVDTVAYRSVNTLTNTGDAAWTEKTGMLAIWILGMYKPAEETTMVFPIVPGSEADLGVPVNDVYFGKIAPDRLTVIGDHAFFKGDGQSRGKIGIAPQRSKGVCGSWDPANEVLTVVTFTQPDEPTGYVNNLWEDQEEPFKGDAIMAYNDGPPEPGKPPLGPFYELESSSPALPLKPGESYTHTHQTVHYTGDPAALNTISERVFGVSLRDIEDALPD